MTSNVETKIEYPALFEAASSASRRGKTWFKRLVVLDSGLVLAGLVIGAISVSPLFGVASMNVADFVAAVVAGAFLGSLFLKVMNRNSGWEDDWYVGRAVAEAVRSESWGYMMRIAPYADDTADDAFAGKIADLLARSKDIRVGANANTVMPTQMTDAMAAVRARGLTERRQIYLSERIHDQIDWYSRRAATHRRWGTIWLIATVVCQVLAAVFAFSALHEAVMGSGMNPADDHAQIFLRVMSLLGSGALAIGAWAQLNRDDELAKAYAFSVQELALTAGQLERARTEDQLAAAVMATESVISRENRSWLARRVEVVDSPGHGG